MDEERSFSQSTNMYEKIAQDILNGAQFLEKFDSNEGLLESEDFSTVVPKFKHEKGEIVLVGENTSLISDSENDTGFTGIVVLSLIELVCKCHEKDPQKQIKIYQSLVQTLVQYKFISPLCSTEAMTPARRNFQNAFLAQMTNLSDSLPSNTQQISKLNYLPVTKFSDQNINYNNYSLPSRFLNDFEEIDALGKGGFGQVVKVRCLMDDQFYAVKKINYDINQTVLCFKVLREVKLLARLNHPNIVRYYSTWIEFGPTLALLRGVFGSKSRTKRSSNRPIPDIKELSEDYSFTNERRLERLPSSFSSPDISFVKSHNELELESKSERNIFDPSSSDSSTDDNSKNSSRKNNLLTKNVNKNFRRNYPFAKSLVLYLQMELGTLTLRDWLTERNNFSNCQRDPFSCIDSAANEHLLRQLLKALDYIHIQGIIHRDVKPSNIFLKQPGNYLLLGDFGLATMMDDNKFDRQIDHDAVDPNNFIVRKSAPNHSIGVGTLTYSSPEQLKSHNYDQKSDMFSVGVIAFELYCPFQTVMERMRNLMELRRGEISEIFEHKWPVETVFIKRLAQKHANLRPSAREVLESGFFQTKNDLIGALKLQLQEQSHENDLLKQEIALLKSKLVEKNCNNAEY